MHNIRGGKRNSPLQWGITSPPHLQGECNSTKQELDKTNAVNLDLQRTLDATADALTQYKENHARVLREKEEFVMHLDYVQRERDRLKEGVERLEAEFTRTFDTLQQNAERIDALEGEEEHWREYLFWL